MNAEVTYDLYEEPARWSRALVVSCCAAVALLALWIFLVPAIQWFAPAAVTPQPVDDRNTLAEQVSAAAATGAEAAPAPADSQSSLIEDAAVTITTATAQLTPNAASVWTPLQPPPMASPFDSDVEPNAEPIAQPPLPRARPRQLSITGSLAIPLPHPRPFTPTDTTGTVSETNQERPDFF
jgi:hypothetical protein